MRCARRAARSDDDRQHFLAAAEALEHRRHLHEVARATAVCGIADHHGNAHEVHRHALGHQRAQVADGADGTRLVGRDVAERIADLHQELGVLHGLPDGDAGQARDLHHGVRRKRCGLVHVDGRDDVPEGIDGTVAGHHFLDEDVQAVLELCRVRKHRAHPARDAGRRGIEERPGDHAAPALLGGDHPAIHLVPDEPALRGLDERPRRGHRDNVEFLVERGTHHVGRLLDRNAHAKRAGGALLAVARMQHPLGAAHHQLLAGEDGKLQRVAMVHLRAERILVHHAGHEHGTRALEELERIRRLRRIQQPPVLALLQEDLDAVARDLLVEAVRLVALLQEAGLQHHGAGLARVHLEAERMRNVRVARLAHHLPVLECDRSLHGRVVGAKEVGVHDGPGAGRPMLVECRETKHRRRV